MALNDLNNDVVDEGFAGELHESRKSACERIKVPLAVVLWQSPRKQVHSRNTSMHGTKVCGYGHGSRLFLLWVDADTRGGFLSTTPGDNDSTAYTIVYDHLL